MPIRASRDAHFPTTIELAVQSGRLWALQMFEWLYHPAGGLVNFLVGGRTINWLGAPDLALPALIAADVWRATPFVTLLCFARLLTIPAQDLMPS